MQKVLHLKLLLILCFQKAIFHMQESFHPATEMQLHLLWNMAAIK